MTKEELEKKYNEEVPIMMNWEILWEWINKYFVLKDSSQFEPPVIHTFEWQLYGHSGKIEAKNMEDALHKVIEFWSKLPYPNQEITRLDILCKKCV